VIIAALASDRNVIGLFLGNEGRDQRVLVRLQMRDLPEPMGIDVDSRGFLNNCPARPWVRSATPMNEVTAHAELSEVAANPERLSGPGLAL
jgi:hypothetical protein